MNKTLLIVVIFSALFLFAFVLGKELKAQQFSPEIKLANFLRSYDEAIKKNPPDYKTAKEARNDIISQVQSLIDANYNEYADKLYKIRYRQAIPSTVMDYVADIDTDTKPNSIPDSDCAKNTTSDCFLDFITSKRTNKKPSKAINVEILILAMEISRTQAATEIQKKSELNVNVYPLEFAKRDLRSYFFAGTPAGAARGLGVILEEKMDILSKLEGIKNK